MLNLFSCGWLNFNLKVVNILKFSLIIGDMVLSKPDGVFGAAAVFFFKSVVFDPC